MDAREARGSVEVRSPPQQTVGGSHTHWSSVAIGRSIANPLAVAPIAASL